MTSGGRLPANGREKPRERISFKIDEKTAEARRIATRSYGAPIGRLDEAALLIGYKQLGVVLPGTLNPEKLLRPS